MDRIDDLKEALRALRDEGVDPDSAGGAVALKFLLEESAEGPPAEPHREAATQPSDASKPLGMLSGWSGVPESRMADFFEISSDEIRLTIPSGRLPKSKADVQRLIALLVLSIDRVVLGADETPAARVLAVAHDYAVADQNFANNVAKKSSLVSRRGARGDFRYRITQPGLERARALMAELGEGDDVVTVPSS